MILPLESIGGCVRIRCVATALPDSSILTWEGSETSSTEEPSEDKESWESECGDDECWDLVEGEREQWWSRHSSGLWEWDCSSCDGDCGLSSGLVLIVVRLEKTSSSLALVSESLATSSLCGGLSIVSTGEAPHEDLDCVLSWLCSAECGSEDTEFFVTCPSGNVEAPAYMSGKTYEGH